MLKWVKQLKTIAKICIIIAVILVQTNIYCRHSAAATYLYICILYIIYFRAVVGISIVEW